MWYAIDYGTSNSLLSYVKAGERPVLLNLEGESPILKSLIFTPRKDSWFLGSEAIEKYIEHSGEGRFFRSLKKFLPEPGFKGTDVFGRRMTIEELIAVFLREMKTRADKECGENVTQVLLGRPALYSLDPSRDRLAEERMKKAANMAGFERVEFCPEPIAAGLDIENSEVEKNILICDFGGGTSDFTLIQSSKEEFNDSHVKGLSGVFVAGDAMDGRIMRDFISEHFGKNVTYKAPMGNNILSFPKKLLKKLCNPAHIAFLQEKENWEFLKQLESWSVGEEDQKYFNQLYCLIEEQLGYPVYAEIERSKITLGTESETTYSFDHPGVKISMPLTQESFGKAIDKELGEIFGSLEKVFEQSKLNYEDISEVRVTGGTGQMPIIQRELESRFGAHKMKQNEVFQSVVNGLANYTEKLLLN